MFRYRLHSPDGDDLGEATYGQMIQAGRGDPRSVQASASASSTLSRSMRRTSRRSSACCRLRLPDASHAGCRKPSRVPTAQGVGVSSDAFAAAGDTERIRIVPLAP